MTIGFPTDFNLLAVDSYNNPVPIDSTLITFNYLFNETTKANNPKPNTTIVRTITKVDDNLITYSLTATLAGTATVRINYNGQSVFSPASAATLIIYAGIANIASATADFSRFFAQAKMVSATTGSLCVKERDSYGNLITPRSDNRIFYTMLVEGLDTNNATVSTFTFTSIPGDTPTTQQCNIINFGPIQTVGFYRVSVTKSGTHISGSPLYWTVMAGFIEPSASFIEGITDYSILDASVTQSFTLQLRDKFGNPPRIQPNDIAQTEVNLIREQGGVYPITLSETNEDYFAASFEFPASGNFTVSANIFLSPVNNSGLHIFGLLPTDPSKTTLAGDGKSKCEQDQKCRFVIQCRDKNGNLQLIGPQDDVTVGFFPTTAAKNISLVYLGYGQFSVEYIGGVNGNSKILVQVNGVSAPSSDLFIQLGATNMATVVGGSAFGGLLVACAGYLIYRHRRTLAMKAEWERMKRTVYNEYNVNNGIHGQSTNLLGRGEEEEWDNNEEDKPAPESVEELRAIQNWVAQKSLRE
jgi:hypothetical protein